MRIVESLSREERRARAAWYRALPADDRAAVYAVLGAVHAVARDFLHTHFVEPSRLESAWQLVPSSDYEGPDHAIGQPFFAVYAIGSTIARIDGPRDTDMLLATNAWWRDSPEPGSAFRNNQHIQFGPGRSGALAAELVHHLDPCFRIVQYAQLPDHYDMGLSGAKALWRMEPVDSPLRRGLDLNIVRCLRDQQWEGGYTEDAWKYFCASRRAFEEKDAHPKLLLFHSRVEGLPEWSEFAARQSSW